MELLTFRLSHRHFGHDPLFSYPGARLGPWPGSCPDRQRLGNQDLRSWKLRQRRANYGGLKSVFVHDSRTTLRGNCGAPFGEFCRLAEMSVRQY